MGGQPGWLVLVAADWICVWLIKCARFRETTPSFYFRGHDAKVHKWVKMLILNQWFELEACVDEALQLPARHLRLVGCAIEHICPVSLAYLQR